MRHLYQQGLNQQRRVAITGMGAVTSLGNSVDAIWQAVLAGRSGIGYIRQFDSRAFPIRIGSEVDVDSLDPVSGDFAVHSSARALRFGIHAADRAWRDAAIDRIAFDSSRACVCIGASTFPIIEDRLDRIADLLDGDAWNAANYLTLCRQRPELLVQSDAASISTFLSRRLGFTGTSLTVQAACSSATHAIGHAYRMIRHGHADLVMAGGADSMLSMMCVTGFTLLGSLSKKWELPSQASRPFDRTRDGFVLAEGSAMAVLEDFEIAQRRGARIYAEVIGYSSSCDAYRFTDVHPDGFGIALSMESALRSAGIAPGEVGYINAHGTSTQLNDRCETKAIRKVFGKHADRVAVSSTKSQLGHLLCAAGAIELALSTLVLHRGVVPPTINLNHPDPECDLDYVPWTARQSDVHVAMSNSCGFGGQNGSIVLRRWDRPRAIPAKRIPKTRRIVVTGVGLISPLGTTARKHFDRLARGHRAAAPVRTAELEGLPIPLEARVPEFDRRRQIPHRMLRKILTRAAAFAVVSASQALRDAGIGRDSEILRKCGLYVGSLGLDQDFMTFFQGLKTSIRAAAFDPAIFAARGMGLIDPLFLVKSLPNSGLCAISIQFGMHGPNLNVMNGAASGLQAIGAATSAIRSGEVDCALAGGYDSLLQLEPAVGQLIAGNVSGQDTPGYVLGEGAAFLLLEWKEHAQQRGARIYGEVLSEAQSLNGLEQTSKLALERAGWAGADVDAIFGDGLGIEDLDRAEADVLHGLNGAHSPRFTAATAACGYCGVAGAVFSTIHALLAMDRGIVPPNLNSTMLTSKRERRKVDRALVWTSDRGIQSAAIALERNR